MEPWRSHMHLLLVQQTMKNTIDGKHLTKKETKMDNIETFMKVAMALNYLREKRTSDSYERRPVLLLSIQIVGRVLMLVGKDVHMVGMRLVKFGQRSAA